ncbi:hypothetical protein AB6A40_010486 [Gnathostoma spinigerum]|uniref:Uncharacterized protein n=1 Tax=Gnathostoma spinigerum TaxID=75299 RepID=A0ABD6F2J3_9BILA
MFLAIGMLVWHSYGEDRYGVVQKDLASVLSVMLQLLAVIEKYVRNLKSEGSGRTPADVTSCQCIENTLNSVISRVVTKFGESLRSAGLTDEEFDALRALSSTV